MPTIFKQCLNSNVPFAITNIKKATIFALTIVTCSIILFSFLFGGISTFVHEMGHYIPSKLFGLSISYFTLGDNGTNVVDLPIGDTTFRVKSSFFNISDKVFPEEMLVLGSISNDDDEFEKLSDVKKLIILSGGILAEMILFIFTITMIKRQLISLAITRIFFLDDLFPSRKKFTHIFCTVSYKCFLGQLMVILSTMILFLIISHNLSSEIISASGTDMHRIIVILSQVIKN